MMCRNDKSPSFTCFSFLTPFLFTLHTSDFQHNADSRHLQKISDDTATVGRVSEGKDLEYTRSTGVG